MCRLSHLGTSVGTAEPRTRWEHLEGAAALVLLQGEQRVSTQLQPAWRGGLRAGKIM